MWAIQLEGFCLTALEVTQGVRQEMSRWEPRLVRWAPHRCDIRRGLMQSLQRHRTCLTTPEATWGVRQRVSHYEPQ